jgi:hypothetical protein
MRDGHLSDRGQTHASGSYILFSPCLAHTYTPGALALRRVVPVIPGTPPPESEWNARP